MTAYYNEHEPYAAQWLRNLIAAGHIAPGDVDARDIQDVTPDDLAGYTQCHETMSFERRRRSPLKEPATRIDTMQALFLVCRLRQLVVDRKRWAVSRRCGATCSCISRGR